MFQIYGHFWSLCWLLDPSAWIFECKTSRRDHNNGVSCCFILIFLQIRESMIYYIFIWKCFLFQFQQHLKHWAKPATISLISGVLSDLTRSRSGLIVENALLRQQLIVLHRQVKQPQLALSDRFLFVLLARFTRFWKQTLHIIQPDTLLRWHRDLFRFYWRLKAKRKQNKPKISPETIDLIRTMAKENRLWGSR
jgi:hypothetical protein